MFSTKRSGAAVAAVFLVALGVAPVAAREPTVVVRATAMWTSTGIDVESGEWIGVAASGQVITGRPVDPVYESPSDWSSRSGPAGQPWICGFFSDELGDHPCLVDGAPYGSLVGMVDGVPFYIGAEPTFESPGSGELFLAVNDNGPDEYFADNGGAFAVRLTRLPAMSG